MSTGGLFKLTINDGKDLDDTFTLVDLDDIPTLVDIERKHVLFTSAHFNSYRVKLPYRVQLLYRRAAVQGVLGALVAPVVVYFRHAIAGLVRPGQVVSIPRL